MDTMNFGKLAGPKKKAIADEVFEWYEKNHEIEIPDQEKQDFYVSETMKILSPDYVRDINSFLSFRHVSTRADGSHWNAFTMATLKLNQLSRRRFSYKRKLNRAKLSLIGWKLKMRN